MSQPAFYDAVILGAGPAGLTAAMTLRQAGWDVLVVEKCALPRDKVCGGFIGPENNELIRAFGIEPTMAREAQTIRAIEFTSPAGTRLTFPVTALGKHESGYGIRRVHLDGALAAEAERRGIEVLAPGLCQEISTNATHLRVLRITSQDPGRIRTITARHVIDARGALASRRHPTRTSGLGFAALFEKLAQGRDAVQLHFVPGGHFGINPVGHGLYNICFIVTPALARSFGGSGAKLLRYFMGHNPWIARYMESAERTSEWKAIAVQKKTRPHFFDGTSFFAGDAVSTVNPIVGGGVSIALACGHLLASLLAAYAPNAVPEARVASDYAKIWKKNFWMKTKLSGLFAYLGHHSFWANPVLRGLAANRGLMLGIFEWYHSRSTARGMKPSSSPRTEAEVLS
ncbi:MAG: NAD(P)/FAD-dependent oxidoreductase [Candidatus Omnitrophota bacterium]